MGLDADPDAGAGDNAAALAHGVGQPQRAAAGTEVLPVQIPGDAERCGEAARPAGEIGRARPGRFAAITSRPSSGSSARNSTPVPMPLRPALTLRENQFP